MASFETATDLRTDDQIAEYLAGRFVGESGPRGAPPVFAREREAKMAKVGKSALGDAMRRLFDKGKIRLEEYARDNRHGGVRIVEV